MPGRDWVLTDEQIVVLPIDALGLEILTDLVTNEGTGAEPNRSSRTWMMMARNARPSFAKDALAALEEGWDWLYRQGLVAPERISNEPGDFFVTRLGREVAQSGDTRRLRASARVALDLHPALESRVRPQFLMGEYDLATFAAMKAVEVRVREMAPELPVDLVGVRLMRAAFGQGGPLCDASLDKGEQAARADLFAGALGTIKNPTSHREIRYEDPTEASEAVMVADLLMRILDRVPGREAGER